MCIHSSGPDTEKNKIKKWHLESESLAREKGSLTRCVTC